jgi:hypothetical protein
MELAQATIGVKNVLDINNAAAITTKTFRINEQETACIFIN